MIPPPDGRRFDILAIGEAMVEFNQAEGAGSRHYLQGFGGDTSNMLVSAARQGARTGYVSAVGDDQFGRQLRAMWTDEGIDHAHVRTDPVAPTGLYLVSHDATGHHFTFYRAGSAASRMMPSELPRAAVADARVLHLSGISLAISSTAADTCYAAIHHARASGTAIAFDTNLRLRLWTADRARAMISDVLALTDIALPSLDDATALWGPADPDTVIDRCLALGARVVALKMGADGAIVADRRQRHRILAHPVRAVDATGAGDAFAGAFLARLAADDDIAAAGRYASVAAALSTTGYGAVEPIPRAAAVRATMEEARPS